MLTTLGVVEAGTAPVGLKNRAARRLGGKPLLEWVVRQATDSERLDRVIVLAGDSPEDHRLSELTPPDVPLVASSGRDALERFLDVLKRYPARTVVRIGLQTPFVDPVLIDRLVSTGDAHPSCDYIGYCVGAGRPAILSPLGIFAERIRADAIRRAAREAKDPRDREQVTRFIYAHPETYNVRLIPVPVELDRDDVRLTLDSEDDWEHVQAIYEALGPERLDWRRIADLLDQQPALRQRMADLNRAAN